MRTKSLIIVLLVAVALLAVQSHAAVGFVRWDTDFNSDTVGAAPAVGPGVSLPSGVTLTAPSSAVGATVVATSGGLTDQPLQLVIPAGTDQAANLAYTDWDAFPFDAGDDHYVFEWDMSIVSSPALANGTVIMARVEGVGIGPSMIKWGLDSLGNPHSVGVAFGDGTSVTNWLPWSFNTPMHMAVEIDTVNDLYSVYKDGAVIIEDVVVSGLSSVYALSLKGAHGGVGLPGAGGTVAIDNFKATVVPEPATLCLMLSGAVLLRSKRRNK